MNKPQHSNYERATRSVVILLLSVGIYIWVGHTVLHSEFFFGGHYHATSMQRITPSTHPAFFWGWQAAWMAAALWLDAWCIRDLICIGRTPTSLHNNDAS
ncbi:MAG: hypothetical protein JWL59_230 [Chthoniobacteraceae bacterium]|nr:hypothetical protein [Chthoniobacteraceae bacterium]